MRHLLTALVVVLGYITVVLIALTVFLRSPAAAQTTIYGQFNDRVGAWMQNIYVDPTGSATGGPIFKCLAAGTAVVVELDARAGHSESLVVFTGACSGANAIPTLQPALRTGGGGSVAIGAATALHPDRLLNVGNDGQGNADKATTAVGLGMKGAVVSPTFDIQHFTAEVGGYIAAVNLLASQGVRTVSIVNTAEAGTISKGGSSVAVDNARALLLNDPTSGGVSNNTILATSGAKLTPAGSWVSVSSKDAKTILEALDHPAARRQAMADLMATTPILFRWSPEHVGRGKPARFNDKTGEYEVWESGSWQVVGSGEKEPQYGLIAENLPPGARTDDGKGLDPARVLAWHTLVLQALVRDLQRVCARTPGVCDAVR